MAQAPPFDTPRPSWMKEVTFHWSEFDVAITRRIATSSRAAEAILVEQARGIFTEIINITPPASITQTGGGAWNVVVGKDAQARGQAKIAGDIRKLYGTPGDAYDSLLTESRAKAAAFWILVKKRKSSQASDLLRGQRGAGFYEFDGGAIHQKWWKGAAKRRADGGPTMYVRDERELNAYIKTIQGRVGHLMSGHNAIAAKLGIAVPAWAASRGGPGIADVEISDERLSIVAVNDVSYASQAGVGNRTQWAIDRQTEKMNRQWQNFVIEHYFTGFKIAA